MAGLLVIFLLAYVVFSVWLGFQIGLPRGRGELGATLGFLFGPLGWITVAVMDPTDEVVANRRRLEAMEHALQMARVLGMDVGAIEPEPRSGPSSDALATCRLRAERDLWNMHDRRPLEHFHPTTTRADLKLASVDPARFLAGPGRALLLKPFE